MTTGPLPKTTNWATLFQPWPRWSPLLVPRASEQCHALFRAYGPGNGIWDPISRPCPQEAGLPFGRCFKVEARVLGVVQLKGPSPPDVAGLPIIPQWFSVFPLSEAMCTWEMQGAFFFWVFSLCFQVTRQWAGTHGQEVGTFVFGRDSQNDFRELFCPPCPPPGVTSCSHGLGRLFLFRLQRLGPLIHFCGPDTPRHGRWQGPGLAAVQAGLGAPL